MSYLLIDYNAVCSIAQDTLYQSTDYLQGKKIIDLIKNGANSRTKKIHLFSREGYFYIIGNSIDKVKFILIDMNNVKSIKTLKDEECISILTRVIKMSFKLWSSMPLNRQERVLNYEDTEIGSKYLLYPFSFLAQQGDLRLLLYRKPTEKRDEKRNRDTIYVFNEGNSDNISKSANNSLYQKAIENIKNLTIPNQEDFEENDMNVSGYSSEFKKWVKVLTKEQRDIVFSNNKCTYKIEGPAGSGKSRTLMLKIIRELYESVNNGMDRRLLFLTHSKAAVESFKYEIECIDPMISKFYETVDSEGTTLKITTLFDLCRDYSSFDMDEQLLDTDAADSKMIQLMLIEQVVNENINHYNKIVSNNMSKEFKSFYDENMRSVTLYEMLAHEFGVVIKGRSQEKLESYLGYDNNVKIGVPTFSEYDRKFLYHLYMCYRDELDKIDQYDCDDIVISTISQIDSPVWRRKMQRRGYDSIIIDEIHMFNFNEVSLVQYLIKDIKKFSITYAIDKSQSAYERTITPEEYTGLLPSMNLEENDCIVEANSIKFDRIFRSSPDIVNLAVEILATGATIFGDSMQNLLNTPKFDFAVAEEMLFKKPEMYLCSEDMMLKKVFLVGDSYIADYAHEKHKSILVVACSNIIYEEIKKYCKEHNKRVTYIETKGDMVKKNIEEKNGVKYFIANIDMINGLEFENVIIVGADKGVIPQESDNQHSSYFEKYASHCRLYTSIMRAKYRVAFISSLERGYSQLLSSSIEKGFISKS